MKNTEKSQIMKLNDDLCLKAQKNLGVALSS